MLSFEKSQFLSIEINQAVLLYTQKTEFLACPNYIADDSLVRHDSFYIEHIVQRVEFKQWRIII